MRSRTRIRGQCAPYALRREVFGYDFRVSGCDFWISIFSFFFFGIFRFFPHPIVEGLLNSWRRVSDRPSWILISKTPARKLKIGVIVIVFFYRTGIKAEFEAETDFRYTYIFKLRRHPILGTPTFPSFDIFVH